MLFNKGLAKQARLLALERIKAEIEGSLHPNGAMITRARQSNLELEAQITELMTSQVNEGVQELREVGQENLELRERLNGAEDVLQRACARAPILGVIIKSLLLTIGGVVSPGETLMDVVPGNEKLIVEARVDPTDIDVVHPGLAAQVRITAFSQRTTVPLDGTILPISADQLTEERTGVSYYLVRVELNDDPSEALGGAELYPGMQAEVLIVTGAQTPLEYLVRPITTSLNRAMREN